MPFKSIAPRIKYIVYGLLYLRQSPIYPWSKSREFIHTMHRLSYLLNWCIIIHRQYHHHTLKINHINIESFSLYPCLLLQKPIIKSVRWCEWEKIKEREREGENEQRSRVRKRINEGRQSEQTKRKEEKREKNQNQSNFHVHIAHCKHV